jgi:hypothetical protein
MMTHNWIRLESAWADAVGPDTAAQAKPTSLVQGLLTVRVANSCLIQELTYRKRSLLDELCRRVPDLKVEGLRLRAGVIKQ